MTNRNDKTEVREGSLSASGLAAIGQPSIQPAGDSVNPPPPPTESPPKPPLQGASVQNAYEIIKESFAPSLLTGTVHQPVWHLPPPVSRNCDDVLWFGAA